MSRQKLRILCGVGIAALALIGPAAAQTVSRDKVDAIEAQINALQQELKAVKAKLNSAERAAEKSYAAATPVATKVPAPPPTAVVKMSPDNRPSICSYDGLNCIALTSRLHLDVGGYNYSPNTAATAPQHLDSGVNARRARLGVLGNFMGDWNYGLVYDLGGSSDGFGSSSGVTCTAGTCKVGLLPGGILSGVQSAFVSYVGIKGLAIEGGYMASYYTLEEATNSNDIMFLERASPQVVAANIAAGDFRSQFGARWYSDWFWAGAYITGPQSGAIHSGSSNPPDGATEQYGGYARAAVHYAQAKDFSFHLGGGAMALFKPVLDRITGAQTLTLSDRPELRIDPTSIISTGAIANTRRAQVYNVEAAGTAGPLFFQGEYFWYNVDRLETTGLPTLHYQGGYAEASWVVTGETRAYNAGNAAYLGVVPANPWSWAKGGWGAWEIAARYSYINLNDRLGFADGTAGGKQAIVTAGLNWYVNRNMRFMLDYMHGKIDKQKGPQAQPTSGPSSMPSQCEPRSRFDGTAKSA